MRKYHINHNYFDKLCPRKAYWMGVLFGRSCLSKSNRGIILLQLPLHKKKFLCSLNKEFKSNYPIRYSISNNTKRCSLVINSRTIISKLKSYGYISGGNGHIRFLPRRYLKSFYRGYLDRRAWFWRGSKHFYVTGTLENIKAIVSFINRHICKITRNPVNRGHLYCLTIENPIHVSKIARYFYSGIKTTIKPKIVDIIN